MEQFVESFEGRKGVLFVLFIALLFSIFLAIIGFEIKKIVDLPLQV
ncbi:hypothetical protein IGJ68_002149 [Enterococcus sp. DIV0564]|nr:hypothetical protein [Enterococcus faecalis]